MKLRKFIVPVFCMAILFSATACSTSRSENTSGPNAVSSDSKNSSSETLSSSHETTSTGVSSLKDDAAENADVTAIKNKAAVKYYGADVNVDAYNINGNMYVKLNDVSSLFKTKVTYDNANNTISVGDVTRASAAYYMPDLSAYPNLDDVIDLPPYEIRTGDGIVDFKFVTKNVSFKDIFKKIDKKLKSEDFTVSTKEQYTELTNGLSEFKQGEMKNTYLKYGDSKQEHTIQVIDGGFDKNKMPIVVIKMAG